MPADNVDDYIEKGIYGEKELKPEEKRMFLGTFRERVIAALYKGQVAKKNIYPQILQACKENKEASLLLNGEISYTHLSKYVKAANEAGIPYKLVSNLDYDTEIGLVLAAPVAVDVEDIFIKDAPDTFKPVTEKKKKGLFSLFKKK
ncbi:YueI family protein [Peribacillus sp. SCS-26]|uniref:YueI family protein n=1 Tax=Paraperibacillus marinus TaxID=3115295 RepID=UPI003905A8FA